MYMLFPYGKRKALTFSYDDGVEQDERLIMLFNKYDLKCTFNLNSFHLEVEERSFETGRIHRPMGRRKARTVYGELGADHEIAVHSYSHPHLEQLSREECKLQITRDRDMLEEIFGKRIIGSAYPFGTYNDTVVDVLRECDIKYARTVESTRDFKIPSDWLRMPATCHHDDPALFPLADKFTNGAPDEPWLFYIWGHSYEFESHNNWERIEELCNILGGRDDVWYATNGEIYEYIKAYESLVFYDDGSIHNPRGIPVWINCGQDVVLLPNETKTLK